MSEGRLIICPTPIGNLGDITKRTMDALASADVVCAEDTRVTGKLLAALGLEKRLERLDEAALGSRARGICERVLAGEVIAYCSDAGMPGVSDPGLRLVREARMLGVPVEVLPGATAGATAYVASGFTCPRFYFGGFFPRKAGEQAAVCKQLRSLDACLIFYESPNRLVAALDALRTAFPQRNGCVCRELTKLHEEVAVDSLENLHELFSRRQEESGIKGEIVIVVDAPSAAEEATNAADASLRAQERAQELAAQGLKGKQISKMLVEELGIPRNEAYDLAVAAAKAAREEQA